LVDDKKISQLVPVGAKPDNLDLFPFTDVSDVSIEPSGRTKSILYSNFGFLEKTGGVMSGDIDLNGVADIIINQDGDLKLTVDTAGGVHDDMVLEGDGINAGFTVFSKKIVGDAGVASRWRVRALNDLGTDIIYHVVNFQVHDNTDGTEDGNYSFQNLQGGNMTEILLLRGTTAPSVRIQNGANLHLPDGANFFLDGGGDVFFTHAANVVTLAIGGTNPMFQWNSLGFSMLANDKFYLNGLGGDHWIESASSNPTMFAGADERTYMRVRSGAGMKMQRGDSGTTNKPTFDFSHITDGNMDNNFGISFRFLHEDATSGSLIGGAINSSQANFSDDDTQMQFLNRGNAVGNFFMIAYWDDRTEFFQDISLQDGKKLFMDNVGDSYLVHSANVISIVAGGDVACNFGDIGVSSTVATGGSLNFPNLAIFAFRNAADSNNVTLQFTNSDTFRFTNPIDRVIFETHRNEVVADDTTIANFRFRGEDDAGGIETYASFDTIVREDAAGAEDGSQRLSVVEGGTLTTYMELRGDSVEIQFFKPLNMSGVDIGLDLGQKLQVEGLAGNTSIRGDGSDAILFESNGGDKVKILNNDIGINTVGKFIFDIFATGHTYMRETTNDKLDTVVGSQLMVSLHETTVDSFAQYAADNATVADASLFNQSLAFYTADNGADMDLIVKYKDAGGVVRTLTIGTMV